MSIRKIQFIHDNEKTLTVKMNVFIWNAIDIDTELSEEHNNTCLITCEDTNVPIELLHVFTFLGSKKTVVLRQVLDVVGNLGVAQHITVLVQTVDGIAEGSFR